MPPTRLVLFEEHGTVPLLHWLAGIPAEAQAKCRVRLGRLAELGHELRRPEADYLEGGLYELRAKHQRVNYRMLYFFHGRGVAVVTHGFSKHEAAVPTREIQLGLAKKDIFARRPEAHTYQEEV